MGRGRFNSRLGLKAGMMRLAVVMVGALMAAGAPMAGQTLGDRALSAAEQREWLAIGQITYGGAVGGAICTGTLVAPDLVLTAGHCVSRNGELVPPGQVQFAAGWRAGKSAAIRYGDEIIQEAPSLGKLRALSQDVALIVLDMPIDADVVQPLAMAAPNVLTDRYSLIGYRRDLPEVIRRNDACDLASTQGAVLLLRCKVVSGNSGAPVLMQRDGEWQIAAVMAAQGRGAGVVASYAVIPGEDLRARIAAQ
jgi:protease YdgD